MDSQDRIGMTKAAHPGVAAAALKLLPPQEHPVPTAGDRPAHYSPNFGVDIMVKDFGVGPQGLVDLQV